MRGQNILPPLAAPKAADFKMSQFEKAEQQERRARRLWR